MPDIDLSALDLDQLKRLEKEVGKAIANYEQRRRAEALAAAEAVVREYGLKLSDLGVDAGPIRKPVEAKYRNPHDATQTWSGRGRQPQWVKAALDSGKKLEDLAI